MSEIRKIYAAHFLAGLSNAAAVTFTLYFLSHGLNQFQIGQLFGVFMIALALLEIPTGGIADTFGHKISVALGLLFQAISFLLFFLFPNFLGFFIGMLAAALGLALQSGATSSLIYELLHKEELHKDFQKIFGRASGYFLIATIIASPLGSLVYKYYPSTPYFFAFSVLLLAGYVIFRVKWEFVKKPPNVSMYTNTLITGVKLTLRNRILMAIAIIGIALTVNRMFFNQNISQPYQVSVGVDVAYIGVIAALVAGVQAFITLNAYKVSQKIGSNLSLLLIILLPNIAVIALGFINTLLAIPVILLLYVGHAFRDPIFSHITHDEVAADKRATMASTISFLTSIIAGIFLPIFGSGVDRFGIHNTLFLLGIFSLVVGAVGLSLFNHKRSKYKETK